MSAAGASRIMLIRHAEKPGDPPPPHGVDKHGDHDPESLSVHGWQRAGALACFFAPTHGPLQSPLVSTPAVIYAAAPEKEDQDGSKSERPLQTVTPLAQKLGLTVDTGFTRGQEAQVAQAAMTESGVVLIAWQHQDAHLIANAILGNDTTAPQTWPGDRFDIVWVFDLQRGGSYSFTQVPQMLLEGDSPDPIAPS
ncbi:MAG: hypothetical protein ACJ8J0_19220 [Longimicrobiaceae bacterium]